MRTITGTAVAYVTDDRYTPASLLKQPTDEAVQNLAYYDDDCSIAGWNRVGTAQITVTFDDDDEIIGNMVDALKAQKQKVQADAQVEINRIDERIQSLLALPASV